MIPLHAFHNTNETINDDNNGIANIVNNNNISNDINNNSNITNIEDNDIIANINNDNISNNINNNNTNIENNNIKNVIIANRYKNYATRLNRLIMEKNNSVSNSTSQITIPNSLQYTSQIMIPNSLDLSQQTTISSQEIAVSCIKNWLKSQNTLSTLKKTLHVWKLMHLYSYSRLYEEVNNYFVRIYGENGKKEATKLISKVCLYIYIHKYPSHS